MQHVSSAFRLLICSLLIGGYGAMYAGSISHDLGHLTEGAKHAHEHQSGCEALSEHAEESHLEVSCFFCSHAPVLATGTSVEQVWTPRVSRLAPQFEPAQDPHSRSFPLAELRGPPAA